MPVIAPDLEPIQETIGEDGIYFEAGDISSLKDVMLASRRMDLTGMSQRVYARALALDWDTIAAQTASIYKRIRG